MCSAEYFRIDYEINPYMNTAVQPDLAGAIAEHRRIVDAHLTAGRKVEFIDADPACPDMTYTANAAVVRGDRAVLATLPRERAAETPHYREWLQAAGFEVAETRYRFSGQGDALACGDLLLAAHGQRTDERAHRILARHLNYEIVSLRTTSSRWYDLDLAVAVIHAGRTLAYHPEALDTASLRRLRGLGLDLIPVQAAEAARFALNLISDGRTVTMTSGAPPPGGRPQGVGPGGRGTGHQRTAQGRRRYPLHGTDARQPGLIPRLASPSGEVTCHRLRSVHHGRGADQAAGGVVGALPVAGQVSVQRQPAQAADQYGGPGACVAGCQAGRVQGLGKRIQPGPDRVHGIVAIQIRLGQRECHHLQQQAGAGFLFSAGGQLPPQPPGHPCRRVSSLGMCRQQGGDVRAGRGQRLADEFFLGAEVVHQHSGAGAQRGGQRAQRKRRDPVLDGVAHRQIQQLCPAGRIDGTNHGFTVPVATGMVGSHE